MSEEKKYLKGMFIKEKTFDNGGTQLRVSVLVDDFINELKSLHEGKDGDWENLIIGRRREPSESGITHYIKVDPWKPDAAKKAKPKAEVKDEDDLPF